MISIIIPCYNSETFISRAVNSVLKQTYSEWELLLIDNGSTDNTFKLLKEYEEKYPQKIKALFEPKQGAPAARNKGLSEAVGEWIQFLDADDELLPTKLEDQTRIKQEFDVDLISGAAAVNGNVPDMPKSNRKISTFDPWLALIGSNLGITSSNLFKKEKVLEVGAWNEKLSSSQEYELMFRMLKAGAKVRFDNKVNTLIYMSDQGISRSGTTAKRIAILGNRIKLRLDIQDYLKSKNLLDKEKHTRINKYIYSSLKNDEYIIPEYVSEQLKILQPKVSFIYKFAKNTQIFFLNLKRNAKKGNDL